jgi:threonine dehydrogenase-like Zn-dependent dehydrogenase
VGLLWGQLLRQSPCETLLQTDIVKFRRDKAAKLGADQVFDPAQEGFAELVGFECPDGVDFIVDATGNSAAIEQAMPLLARGGTLMIFGVCPQGSQVRFDPFELYNRQARIIAAKMPPGTLDRSARLIGAGRIPCEEIVTATLGLDELAKSVAGFNDFRDRQVKVAIDPWA